MIHTKRNLISLLVVSLFLAVISLPGAVSLAAVAPVASAMPPVRDGMVTPVRIALDPSGNYYYVTDSRAKAVLKFNVYGRLLQTLKTDGIPLGIALAANGNIIVTQGAYVSILNPVTGAEITKAGVGIIAKANAVAVDGVDGRIYVTDGGKHQVHVFDSAGAFKASFGTFGAAYQLIGGVNTYVTGCFFNPTAIAYEKDAKQIAVADSMNGRIQFFSTTDASQTVYPYVKRIGLSVLNDDPLDFISPQGIAFEYDKTAKLKRMYVLDTWKSGIQVIDPVVPVTGTYLSMIGAGNLNPGAQNYPYGILGGIEDWQFSLPSDTLFDPVYSRLLVVSGDSSIKIIGIDGGKSPSENNPLYLTITPAPLNTNLSTYAISGSVKAGSSIAITTNTTAVSGAVSYVGKAWSANISGLVPGSNKITVVATDATTGKTLANEITVVYSLNAPALIITTPSGTVTKDASASLAGTVDAGSTVTIRNNNTGISTTAVVTGTSWTGSSVLVNNAANQIVVSATKPGSSTASASVSIVSDRTAPLLHVSALPDGSYSSGTMTQNIFGYVEDVNPFNVSVTVNGGPATIVNTSLPKAAFDVSVSLQVGANIIVVQATDLAGNVSFSNTRTIHYDPSKPTLTIGATPADNSYTKTNTATIGGTVVPTASTVTITNNGTPVAGVTNVAGNWSGTVNLANGQNTIVVTAVSGASEASLKRTVTLDTIAPQLAITSPAASFSTNMPNIEIKGTAVTDTPVVLTATVNSVAVTPAPVIVNGTFTFNANLVAGASPNSVVVTATDSAGNVSTATRSVYRDITAPGLTLNQIAAGFPRSISGTVESQAGVTVKDGATSFPVTINGTTWSADLTTADYNATTIQIKATDDAGNASTITGLASYYNKPSGDFTGDSVVNATDAQNALQCAVGLRTPLAAEILRADIGPLLKGAANPNGVIDIIDAILILRKSVDNLYSW